MIHTDVIIVGGGPAGSSCAGRLKQGGAQVIVLDKHRFPRVKPCAGWLTPRVWKRLGIDPEEYPYHLTTFGALHVSFGHLPIKFHTRQFAIRRVEFDDWLLQRSGAPVCQHQVDQITIANGRFNVDNEFSAKYVVGAGGTSCPVHRSIFGSLGEKNRSSQIVALEEEFEYPAPDQKCRLWFFRDHLPGYSWLVPKANGWVNVGIGAIASSLSQMGYRIRDYWQQFIQMLEQKNFITGHPYKPLGYSYFLRSKQSELQRGNAFLVGDSAGLATRDMGEGISPAIESGILAADAILNGTEYSVLSIPRFSFRSSDFLGSIIKRF